jgi:hypothetical protein
MRKAPYGDLEAQVMNDITDWSAKAGRQFNGLEEMIRAYWQEHLPEAFEINTAE